MVPRRIRLQALQPAGLFVAQLSDAPLPVRRHQLDLSKQHRHTPEINDLQRKGATWACTGMEAAAKVAPLCSFVAGRSV